MKTASVRELRNAFPKIEHWLDLGEDVLVTKRGRVVARIVPVASPWKAAPQWPDFMGRLREIYGDKITSDSQTIIDEGRGEY